MRGISGDDPEGGARRGVPRRRLITARPGRHGTPTARHDDLAARSSLYGSGGNAGEGSVGPEPKIATVERREAGVPRYGTQGASIGAWPAAQRAGPTDASQASVRLSALRHPSSGCAKPKAKPGRKDAPPEQDRLSGEGEMRPYAQRFGSNDATPGTGPPLAIRAQPSLPRRPALYMETIEWPPGWRKADGTRPA